MSIYTSTMTLPVAPYVGTFDGANDVVLSVLGLAPAKHLTFAARPAAGARYSNITFTGGAVDLQAMIDLNMSGVLSFSANVKSQVFYYLSELKAVTPVTNPNKESVIVAAEFSVGLRIGIFALNLSADANLDIYSLAAKASLEDTQTAYQVQVVGTGLEALHALTPLITSSTGAFTIETLQTIGAAQAGLDAFLAGPKEKLTPALTSVTVDLNKLASVLAGQPNGAKPDLYTLVAGRTFGLERAYKWTASRANAMKDAENNDTVKKVFDLPTFKSIVGAEYQQLLALGPDKPDTKVAGNNYDIVTQVLFAGRD